MRGVSGVIHTAAALGGTWSTNTADDMGRTIDSQSVIDPAFTQTVAPRARKGVAIEVVATFLDVLAAHEMKVLWPFGAALRGRRQITSRRVSRRLSC
jgi:hypothetical protein